MTNPISRILVAVAIVIVVTSPQRTSSMPDNGLVSVQSHASARETLDRFLAALAGRSLTVYARIDHAAGAASFGMSPRPTEVVIFGNQKGGTALMQEQQSAGIDLPLKAIVWEDASGKAWLTYNDPAWIAKRHELGTPSAAAVMAMGALPECHCARSDSVKEIASA